MNETELNAFKALLGQIEEVVKDDNKAEINGRTYQLSAMTHKARLPFLQYYQDMQPNPKTGLSAEKMNFEKIEGMLAPYVMFEGATLKNLPQHFDKYPQDYMAYTNTFLMVITYPFISAQLQPLKDS